MSFDPEFEKARELAINYIGIDHSKSSGRVRQKLIQKGINEGLADRVVCYYQELDYIDDQRAARRVAARYGGRQLRSQRAMTAVFIQNGIDPQVARQAAQALDPDAQTAVQLCRAYFDQPGPDDQMAMMKLLTRRGYPPGLAREVIRAILNEDYGA